MRQPVISEGCNLGKKTVFWCDLCAKETDKESDLQNYTYDEGRTLTSFAVCKGCERAIVAKTIQAKGQATIVLRPWCNDCKGTGKVEEEVEWADFRTRRRQVDCKKCRF